MHPQRVTVWYALWSVKIIRPFSFETTVLGTSSSVNSESYPKVITHLFVLLLDNIALEVMWFQQDFVP